LKIKSKIVFVVMQVFRFLVVTAQL